jgi:hypothetical protein
MPNGQISGTSHTPTLLTGHQSMVGRSSWSTGGMPQSVCSGGYFNEERESRSNLLCLATVLAQAIALPQSFFEDPEVAHNRPTRRKSPLPQGHVHVYRVFYTVC